MVLGFRRLLKCRVEANMITDGIVTAADSTLGVEASQETFPEICEGSVKKLRAIYKETLPAKLFLRKKAG